MRKYEFTGETKVFLNKTLHRIRAVVDFGTVHAGDVGGWIDKEENLNHCGDAWIYGNAKVYGDTEVYGNAKVYGNACVYGDAKVYGNACVYGDTWVGGNAEVYGNAKVGGDAKVYGGKWEKSPCFIQGTRWSINISSPNTVRCGCQDHTWQKWHYSYAAISRLHNADDVLEEYIRYFNLLCDMYGHEDCKISR